jgi:putative transposase
VWLYYRFGVSLRDVSELMLARGIEVSHEAIRLWTLRFGTEYARRLRRTRGTCSNIWHLDELCLIINGERGWLWRAVDDAGEVLDILVQRRRSALAAARFFRKLVKGGRMVPRAIVTDRLASYAAAKAVVMPTSPIFAAGARTTVSRIRTNPSAGVSEGCNGSRACGTRRASVRCSVRSATSFGPVAMRSRPPTIAQ